MKFYDVDSEFTFGKYEGKTIKEVFEKDPKYIDFCFNNIDEFYVSPAVLRELRDMNPKFALPADSEEMNDDVLDSFLEDAEMIGDFEEDFKEEEDEFGWDDDLDLGGDDDFDDYQSYDEEDDY